MNDILTQNISIGYCKDGARGYRWPTMHSTVQELIDFLSEHREGKKDGMSILQGSVLPSGQRHVSDRKATAVDQLSLLILDIDTGDSIDRIEKKCRELGLFAILHTTFSHNGTETKVKRDKVLAWAESTTDLSEQQIIDYMREVKRINQTVLQTMRVKGTVQDNDGVQLVIEHDPMPKLRVILVLDKPFVIAEREGSQKKAIELWKSKYFGVARLLNATADRACSDPSRLMYTPRHPPGRTDFDFRVVPGKGLDLEKIAGMDAKGRETSNQWLEEGESEQKEYKTRGILPFVAKHADHFDAVGLCRDLGEVRKDDGEKVTIACPNDDAHSDPGNPEDMGFFAGTSSSGSFVLKCMHDACAELDRVDLLDMLCQNAGFTVDDLMPYVAEIADPEDVKEEAPFTNSEQIIKWLKDDANLIHGSQVDNFAKMVAETNPTPIQLDQIATLIHGKAKDSRASIVKTAITGYQKTLGEQAEKKKDDDQLHDYPEIVIARLQKEADKFAVVLIKGDLCVLKLNKGREIDGRFADPYDIMSVDTYKQLRCNENVSTVYNGENKKFNIGKCFMEWDGRKTYDNGLVFEPPPSYARGRIFNHWVGFTHEPVEGDWSLIRDHILNVICRGNDEYFQFVMTWIAHIFQRPGEKTGAAIVLRGKKGTGKSIIFDKFMNYLLNQYAMTIANSKQIVGQFNAHLFGKLFVCLEEAVWAGDSSGEGVLKHLLTGENMTYEFKGLTSFKGTNYTRVAFLSNEEWVVPATYDERRFCILSPSEDKVGDKEYFQALGDAVNDPTVQAAFIYDMINTEVEDFNILRFPPRTKWLEDQIETTTNPDDNFFLDLISANGTRIKDDDLELIFIPDDMPSDWDADLLYAHYRHSLANTGLGTIRRARPYTAFEKKLKRFFQVTITKRLTDKARISTITFPPMNETRARLEKEGHLRKT